MQNFKSVTTRKINQIRKTAGVPFWQRNYYEHINNNPLEWELDKENPQNCRGEAFN